MKLTAVFSTFAILFGVHSLPAHAETELVADVTTIAVNNSHGALPKHTVCFTAAWENAEPEIYAKVLELQSAAPEAFYLLDQQKQDQICFDPEKVPTNQKGSLEELMALVQQKTGNQTILPSEENHEDIAAKYPVVMRNDTKPFSKKLIRTFSLIQGTQIASLGVLMLLPPSITKWSADPMGDFKHHMRNAYTKPPVWDHDDWYINYIGHPVSGAIYYNVLRSQGAKPWQSFLFSTAQSVFWEYVVEAGAEQPSIQDLLFTSTIGSVMGEGMHQLTLRMAKNGFNLAEKAIVTVLNPGYVMNNGYHVKRRRVDPFTGELIH